MVIAPSAIVLNRRPDSARATSPAIRYPNVAFQLRAIRVVPAICAVYRR